MIRIEPSPAPRETQYIVTDYTTKDRESSAGHDSDFIGGEVTIHPWDRAGRKEVAIRVTNVDSSGRVFPNDEYVEYRQTAIVDTKEFLDAVLLAFPQEICDLRD